MRHAGYVELGKVVSKEQCQDILRYLENKMMIDVRGSGKAFHIHDVPSGARLGDYPLETIVDCPHILDTANDPALIKLMTDYLGFKPTIVSLGLRWSFPCAASTDTVQRFHRDSEPGSAKVLVYLTDVDHLSGPHAYVEGTHRDRMPLRLRPFSDEEVERKYGGGVIIRGAAGTGFAIDTKGIHRGMPPAQRPRLILGIQYALLPCFLYEYSPVRCRRAAQFDAYTNRLMIARDEAEREQPRPVKPSTFARIR